ncbi:hypothetical protein B0H13DRAFT_2367033 [Mycena leptocephala]|nr:hypothetical protein B0H13DRAFT_2367033 [Mycena leptocephala]
MKIPVLVLFSLSLITFAVPAPTTQESLTAPHLTPGNEFIGWHGTNEKTAALWIMTGAIIRPTTPEGQTKGKSGLDAELGPGLYISDSLNTAEAAAVINAQTNHLAGKVQIPELLRGNAGIREQERATYIATLPPINTGSAATMRLGPLTATQNQMLIPESENPKFEAQCFDLTGIDSPGAEAFEKAGNKVTYTDAALITAWRIRREDIALAKATIAAIEKKCTK